MTEKQGTSRREFLAFGAALASGAAACGRVDEHSDEPMTTSLTDMTAGADSTRR